MARSTLVRIRNEENQLIIPIMRLDLIHLSRLAVQPTRSIRVDFLFFSQTSATDRLYFRQRLTPTESFCIFQVEDDVSSFKILWHNKDDRAMFLLDAMSHCAVVVRLFYTKIN